MLTRKEELGVANNPNKELATGLQLVLDAHILIGQMMSQYIANTVNPQELQEIDSKKPREETDTSPKACKACGEIGHIAKECPDEWPHCDTNYSTEAYPTQVTCFLCEGNNHVPAQCQLYPMVLHVSQQAKEEMLGALKKRKREKKHKYHVNDLPRRDIKDVTCFRCKNQGHYANKCPKRRM